MTDHAPPQRTDGERAREDAVAARREALDAVMTAADVVRRLDALRSGQDAALGEIARVAVIATETRDQAVRTNGRVTQLELWQAELRGIAQGSGGSARLLMYLIGTAASTAALLGFAMRLLER